MRAIETGYRVMRMKWTWLVALATLLVTACGESGQKGCGSACRNTVTNPTLADTIAVNTHYGSTPGWVDQVAIARLRSAGVSMLRNDLGWASVEQEPGVYDFATPGFDALVEAAEHEGLHILFVLDYGNPLYGSPNAVVSETGRTAFAAFAAAAAKRYGGRGHMWEIWNEPNLVEYWYAPGERPDPVRYAQLVKAVVPAVRAVDPAGKILIGSAFMGFPALVPIIGGVPGMAFIKGLLATGVQTEVVGITAHFYRPEQPETVTEDVTQIRQMMEESGTMLPLWSGEWGYSTYDPRARPTGFNYLPAVSPERQAAYLARMLLTNYGLGLAGSVYYEDRDPPNPDPGNIEDHFGILNDNLTAKPAYDALATLARLVGNASGPGSLALPEGEHGMMFQTEAGPVVALWSERSATWTVTGTNANARILARDGQDITPPGLMQGVKVSVEPYNGPIYLLGDITVR